jgi:hypothetical protein
LHNANVHRRRIALLTAAVSIAAPYADAVGKAAPARADAAALRVVLTGDNRRPVAGEPWRFNVRATTADDRPARGTLLLKVLMGGRVADVIGVLRFSGARTFSYRWSPILAGGPAVLQATVVTAEVARRAGYPVHVVGKKGRPQFGVTLAGDAHVARRGKRWDFVVRARDARGLGVGGTAVVRVVVGGRVADTVGWFGFRGAFRHTYRWSHRLRGAVALLQVRVIGPGGARTAGYMVRVR